MIGFAAAGGVIFSVCVVVSRPLTPGGGAIGSGTSWLTSPEARNATADSRVYPACTTVSNAAACTCEVCPRSVSDCLSAAISAVSNHNLTPAGGMLGTSFCNAAHTVRHSGRMVMSPSLRIACS